MPIYILKNVYNLECILFNIVCLNIIICIHCVKPKYEI